MIWKIIIGLVIALAVLWVDTVLQGESEEDEERNFFARDPYTWGIAIALAMAFMLPGFFKEPAIWMLFLYFAAMALIVVWWHGFQVDGIYVGGGSNAKELFYFILLEGVFFAAAMMTAGMLKVSLLWPILAIIAAIGVMLTEMLYEGARYEKYSSTWWKIVAIVMVAAIIFAGVKVGVSSPGAMATSSSEVSDDSVMTEDELTEDEDEEVSAEAEDILIKWTKKESNRIDSEFSSKLKAKAGDDGEITPEIVKETILEDCKDPSVLAIWGYKFGLWDDPDDYKDLIDKSSDGQKRLSENGVRLYNRVEGYLGAVTAKREKAPKDGLNSGYDDGFVVAEEYGITGDRSGTRMTCPNGEVFWVMDRCCNIVYRGGSNPGVPTGKTDNPSKPKGKGSPTDTPSGPKYHKDKTKGTQGELVKPGEPDPDTNNGKGSKTSKADTKDSTSNGGKTYKEVKKEVQEKKEINQNQKTGNDSNTPSTPAPSSSTKVDNNGDKGNGGAPINKPTPKKEPQTVKNDPPADHMEEPD